MRIHNQTRSRSQTNYIQLDSRKCQACWKCITACRKDVIDKIDFWFHKHSRIKNSNNCVGCGNCVKICEYGAIKFIKSI
jgi:ferredoxin